MPATSKNQKLAMLIAENVKSGKQKAKPGSPSAKMAKSMTKKQLNDFTSKPVTKRKASPLAYKKKG